MDYNTGKNFVNDDESLLHGLSCPEEEDRTQQQFKDETDINTIVKRFGLTGELPQDVRIPQSGDFTNVTDFHTAYNAVIAAEKEFMKLPGDMRARFNNDPQELLMFMEDERNREEATKLGLLKTPDKTRDTIATPTPGATEEPKQ